MVTADVWYRRSLPETHHKRMSENFMTDGLTASEAFRDAGAKCFVRNHAPTIYVVCSDDYIFPSCGDHLTTAVREVSRQYNPPADEVTVFLRV